MIIDFQIIPHKEQRYPTVGDYRKGRTGMDNGPEWKFRVSRMKDTRYMVLVFLHEVIEFFLCRQAGIKMRDIDKFDMDYEQQRQTDFRRARCGCVFHDEPGDDPHAPYHRQHLCATQCEHLIATCAGVDWSKYSKAVESL